MTFSSVLDTNMEVFFEKLVSLPENRFLVTLQLTYYYV